MNQLLCNHEHLVSLYSPILFWKHGEPQESTEELQKTNHLLCVECEKVIIKPEAYVIQ